MQQQYRAPDDDRLMSLVDLALAQPPGEREAWLRRECAGDSQLLEQASDYIHWEERMGGFLLEPFCSLEMLDPALDPGELLEGRFRIVREVGEGGMAIVYEARDETLGKRIAVKVAKAGFRTRLTPEVRHATQVAHDNVCKIFDFHTAGTDRGEIDFVTMEFLDGPTLTERLRDGPLPEREARAIARQLCAGLAAAHRSQVVHGDLKSNNFILTQAADGSLRAVITDFGLAHGSGAGLQPAGSGPEESDEAVGGAGDYMAPELWQGEKASVASDIYALGCVCYEMLSGMRLHEPGAPGQERRGRKPPRVHRKWDGLLARCLDPDPARRYQSVAEIEKELAPPDRRWMLVAAGLVLAAAVGVGVWNLATAPKETVRLAVAPFESESATAPVAADLLRDTTRQVARIKSNSRTKFTAVSLNKATHTLRGTLDQQNGKIILHAHVTDERTHGNGRDWQLEYAPGDLRYAPVALAGIVTAGFRLPPLAVNATMSPAATKDYWNGMYYLRRNSTLNKAIASMERAVAEDPASPLAYAGLAEARWYEYRLARDKVWLDRVRESLRDAEERNPDLAPVHRVEGYLAYVAGLYEQAIAEYQRAIELDSKDAESHMWLGEAYEDTNQFDEALAEYRKALESEPNYVRTYQALGTFYLQRSKFREGATYHKKAVDLVPDEPNLRFNLAVAYLNLGRFADEEHELRYSIGLQETMSALHMLGLALMYQGKDGDAIPYFERALKLDSQPGSVERFAPLMYLGIAYQRLGNPARAMDANRRGLAMAEADLKNPRDGYTLSFAAYFDAALGDRHHAETEITQALGLSNASEVRWNAVLTYEKLGLREKTLDLLSTASSEQLADVSRWPNLAELHKDFRFSQLLAAHQIR
jgi:serine/threonine protein kinase/tetratricopeptide (TPR) repeat protein